MKTSPNTIEKHDQEFFRCAVTTENSKAVVRVGRRKTTATLQETSIDGFTILVSSRNASALKVGRPWILEHEGTRIEVHPQWFFDAPGGSVQIGLRRLRDLTPQPSTKSLLAKYGGRRYQAANYSAIAFGGFVLFLFSLMALPGLGERLGTAERIQGAFRWVINEVDHAFGQYL